LEVPHRADLGRTYVYASVPTSEYPGSASPTGRRDQLGLPAHRRQRLRGFTLAENRAAATVVDREPVQATETATSASPTP